MWGITPQGTRGDTRVLAWAIDTLIESGLVGAGVGHAAVGSSKASWKGSMKFCADPGPLHQPSGSAGWYVLVSRSSRLIEAVSRSLWDEPEIKDLSRRSPKGQPRPTVTTIAENSRPMTASSDSTPSLASSQRCVTMRVDFNTCFAFPVHASRDRYLLARRRTNHCIPCKFLLYERKCEHHRSFDQPDLPGETR